MVVGVVVGIAALSLLSIFYGSYVGLGSSSSELNVNV
jgi:hypothetical protein